jgi:hypothetical protein
MNRFCRKCGHYFNPEPDPLPTECPACGLKLEDTMGRLRKPIPPAEPPPDTDAWFAAGHAFGRWIVRHSSGGSYLTHEQAWQATSAALRAFVERQALQSPVVDR